ncbi:MAG: DNA-protecting protein DprA [Clostridia bacterium]|nr:DNA-protecting protein DprA [Clostridia bacterium]
MKLTPEEKAYLWLNSFPLDLKEKQKLLLSAGNSADLVRKFSEFRRLLIDFQKESVYNTMRETLTDGGAYFRSLVEELEKRGIIPVTLASPEYPEELKTLRDAPLVLYAKGELGLLRERKFTVVGSRRTPPAAIKTGTDISKAISKSFAIVTGFADGGDGAAIEGGMQAGKVICVLASGFSALPQGKLPLLNEVAQKGLLLSPYPMKTGTRAFSYEYRNKILAALGEGTLVISAGEKSGALITAKYAKKAGKPLFALPYSLGNALGEGCNALIQGGAYLTQTAGDILSRFGLETERNEQPIPPLSEEEERALNVLRERSEWHISELSEKTQIPVFKLTAILSSLEVKGLVAKIGGNRYEPV